MRTHIVTWGAGPDSTYFLKHLLESTDEPVVAVSIYGDHLTDAVIAQLRGAVRRLSAMLRDIRHFDAQEVVLRADPPRGETACQAFASMMVASEYEWPIVYWCCNALDFNPEYGRWALGRDDVLDYYKRQIELYAELRMVNEDVPKDVIRESLGPLWDETISCEDRRRGKQPCGFCNKCRERAAAIARKIIGEAT